MRRLPNIILITADSLRADHCSFLKGRKHLTPFLDKIASEGLIFENAYSNGPMTAISLPAIMTGTLPVFKRSTKIGSRITISEVLRKLGYVTLGYMSSNDFAKVFSGVADGRFTFIKSLGMPWHTARKKNLLRYLLSLVNSSLRKDHKSLEEFVNWLTVFSYSVIEMPWDLLRSYFITAIAKLLLNRPPEVIPMLLDHKVTKLAISSLKAISTNFERPFFLWLHYMSTHMPYGFSLEDPWESCIKNLKERPLIKKVLKRQKANYREISKLKEYYKLGVKEFDKNLQMLFEGLEELDVLDNTIIIVTSDHGEEFFEHGEYGHPSWKLYDVNLRVPLVIWGTEDKGRIKRLLSGVDIFPTLLLDLLRIKNHALIRAVTKILEGKSVFSEGSSTIISEGIQGKDPDKDIFVDVVLGKTSKVIYPGVKIVIRATNNEGYCIIENIVGKRSVKTVKCSNENLIETCKARLNEILGKSKRDEKLALSAKTIRVAYHLRYI